MNIKYCLLLLLCLYGKVHAQEGVYNTEFIDGKIYLDTRLPDMVIGKAIRYKDSVMSLHDFPGKLIILDFWFTHCGDCLAQFPREDSLQRVFGKDIQIIPVAYETAATVNKFLARWEPLHHQVLQLPFIVGDTMLNRFFDNPYFPHYIWLSPDMRVIGQTTEYFLTAANIQAMIKETAKLKPEPTAPLDSARTSKQQDLMNYYFTRQPSTHE
jgi:thiol-disulfide isomerase/thioredoxin